MRKPLSFLTGLIGLSIFGQGIYMGAKAELAQVLMDRAWAQTTSQGEPHKPWKWMDAYPVAKLSAPKQQESAIVLNHDSGQALAFGPAVMMNLSPLNEPGMKGIAAHKNTHFSFLRDLETGDPIELEQINKITRYEVIGTQIIDTRQQGLPVSDDNELALVTCYPFDAVSFNGPLRYVVFAKEVQAVT